MVNVTGTIDKSVGSGLIEVSKFKVKAHNFRVKTYKIVKRIIGFVCALIGLILASPIMIITAIAIKLDSKGPVLFKQERTGYKGKVFKVFKFRSMAVNNDVHDFSHKDAHTRVGAFIRKTSIDELPQLFNVLLGQMAFIGPRPWITDYWDNMNSRERHRCDVLPGITGLAQAKGRNSLSIFEKINYDLEYVTNFSLWQDIKIIFLTLHTVLSKKGADAGKSVIQNELNDLVMENSEKLEVTA